MWRCGSVVVAVLVLEIISSHPLSSETKYECARQLGLDCCPCPSSTDLEDLGSSPSTIQNKKLSVNPQNRLGKEAESSDFNPVTSGIEDEESSSSELDSVPAASSPGAVSRREGLDDCSCRCRGSDSEGSPSNFLPRALHSLRPILTPSSSKEDPKPLLQPEVELASSVLGTLKEATEEEYKDAVARDAVRSAARASEAQLGDSAEETGIVTIIMNPHEDEDALIQEASNVHETRCTHPLGATRSSSVQSPHKGLFFRSDMDSGASNVNEQVFGNTGLENTKLKSVKNKPALPRFESLGVQPLRIRDSLNLLNFNKHKHITDNNKHSTIFKPSFRPLPKFKTLERAEISRNSQKEISDMDTGPLPSNINERFLEVEPKMSRPNLKLSVPIKEWKSPLKLKDLWKLKEVELIPPRLSNVKINIPTLELPPIKRQRVVGKCAERDEITQGDAMKTKILDIVPSASQKNQESDVSTNTEILDSLPNMSDNIPSAQDDSMKNGLQSINDDTKSLNNDIETSETQTSIIESIPIEGVNLMKSGSSNTESIVIENGAPSRVIIIENGKANQFTSDDYVNEVEPINFNLSEEAINLEDILNISADDKIEISDFDALGDTDVDASNIAINSQLVEMDYDNEDLLRDTEPTEVNNATSSETEPLSIDKLNKLLNTQHYMRSSDNAPQLVDNEDILRETEATDANNSTNSETETTSYDKVSKLLNTEHIMRSNDHEGDEATATDTSSQHYVRSSDNAPQLVDSEDILRETEATDANNSTNSETETTSYDKISKLLNTEHIMRSNDHESDEATADEVSVRNLLSKPNTDVSYGDLQQLSDLLLHKSNHNMTNDQRSLEDEEGESAEDDNDQIEEENSENITNDSSNTDMQNMDTTDLEQVVITALGAGDNQITSQDESQDNQSNSLESIDDSTIINNESRNVEEKSCLSDFSTAQDISRPEIPKENNEMMVEASAPMASVISQPILRASPFEGIVEPLPLVGNNLFNNPLPNIENILNLNTELSTLDKVRSGIENILGLNSEKAADNVDTDGASSEFVLADDCSDADPTMATDASTTKAKSVLPSLSPKEDLNLDIFQIRPLALSKVPGIDLNSLKTSFAIPKTLDLRPVKLQSSLGRNGRVLGATLTFGPDRLGSSSPRLSSQTVTKQLANMPSVDDFRDTLRAHTENFIKSSPLSSPLIPTLRSSSTLEDIHDNLRLQTKKSMRNIQKTFASTFNEAKAAQEKYAKPQDMLEDMNDKLEALHMDFNDRLTSIHERIFDQRNEPLVLPSMIKESKQYEPNNRPVKKLSIPSTDFRGSQIKSNINIKPYRISKAATSLVPKSVDVPKLYTTSMKPPFSVPLKRDHNLKLKEVKPITELIRNDNSHGLRTFKPIVHDTNKHSVFTHREPPLTRGFKPKSTPRPRIGVGKRPPTPKFIRHGHHNVDSHRKHFGDTRGFASEVKPLRVLPPTNPIPLNYGISRKLPQNFIAPSMRSSQGRIPQNTVSGVETKPKAPLTKQSRPSSSSSQIAPDPKPLTEGAASEAKPTSRRITTQSLPWPTLSNSDLLKRVREKSALNLPTISLQGRISQNAGSAVETKPKAPLTKQSRPLSSTSQIAPDPKPVMEGLASDIQPTLRKAFLQPISRISSQGRISQNIGSAVEAKLKAPLTKLSRPFSSTSQIAPNPKPLNEGCESIVNPTPRRVTQGLWPRLSDSALLERVRGKSVNHPTLSLQGRISQNAGTAVESKPKAPLTKQSRPSSIDPKPLTEGSASDIKSTSRKAMSPMSIISSQGRISQNAGTAVESKPKAPLTKQSRPSSIDPKPLTVGSTSDIKPSLRKATSQSLPWPNPTDNAFLERVREALKSRISSLNKPMKTLNNVKHTSNDNDMAKAASEYNEVVVLKDDSMKENVSYRCKMVCVKEPVV